MDSRKRRAQDGRPKKNIKAEKTMSFRLTNNEYEKFKSRLAESGIQSQTEFIKVAILENPVKVVKIDKAMLDYYTRLTTFYAQFRAIGVNYNQIVKALNTHFTEQKALGAIYNLEKMTIKLVELNQKIVALSNEFYEKWLQK